MILGTVLRSDRFPQHAEAALPQALYFRYPKKSLPVLPSKYGELLKRSIVIFDLPPPPDESVRPSDALLNIVFQAALLAARPGFMQPIYQPVHQHDFISGRTDVMWPISDESTALVRRLLSIGEVPTDISELMELRRLLGEANEKRRKMVDLSRSGKAPHMFNYGFLGWAMRGALADEAAPEDFKRSVKPFLMLGPRPTGRTCSHRPLRMRLLPR